MPLSEDEQRILSEIERHLEESDPRLAREVSETTVYRHALGSMRWSTGLVLAGAVVMILTLRIHFLLAFLGFLVMLVGALGFERNLRLMGKAGMHQVSSAIRAANPNLRGEDNRTDDED